MAKAVHLARKDVYHTNANHAHVELREGLKFGRCKSTFEVFAYFDHKMVFEDAPSRIKIRYRLFFHSAWTLNMLINEAPDCLLMFYRFAIIHLFGVMMFLNRRSCNSCVKLKIRYKLFAVFHNCGLLWICFFFKHKIYFDNLYFKSRSCW